MTDGEKRAGIAVGLLLAACGICVAVGSTGEDHGRNPSGWYLTAWILGIFASVTVLMALCYPLAVRLSRWAASERLKAVEARSLLDQARAAAKAADVGPPPGATPAYLFPELPPSRSVEILKAVYGRDGRDMNVTDVVRSHVTGGRLRIKVNNDVMGDDPNVGVGKHLWVQYRYGPQGTVQTIEFPETSPQDPNEPWANLPPLGD